MDTKSSTILVAFSKEVDEEFQKFLILMNRIEKEMWRLEMAMTELKFGYVRLDPDKKFHLVGEVVA